MPVLSFDEIANPKVKDFDKIVGVSEPNVYDGLTPEEAYDKAGEVWDAAGKLGITTKRVEEHNDIARDRIAQPNYLPEPTSTVANWLKTDLNVFAKEAAARANERDDAIVDAFKQYLDAAKTPNPVAALGDEDIELVSRAILVNNRGISPEIEKSIWRERKIRKTAEALRSLPDAAESAFIILQRRSNLFNINDFASRTLGIERLWGLSGGETSIAIEAANRVLAEKNQEESLNLTRILDIPAAIGQVLLEFAAVPDLMSKIDKFASLPVMAQRIISTSIRFALREAIQLPSEGETAGERIKQVGISTATGAVLGAMGGRITNPFLRVGRVAGTTAGFMGLTAVRGGDIDDIIETGVLVLGFEAFGFVKSAATNLSVKMERAKVAKAIKAVRAHNPDLKGVPDEAIKKVLESYRQISFWQSQYKKGKVSEDVMIQRINEQLSRVQPIAEAIAKSVNINRSKPGPKTVREAITGEVQEGQTPVTPTQTTPQGEIAAPTPPGAIPVAQKGKPAGLADIYAKETALSPFGGPIPPEIAARNVHVLMRDEVEDVLADPPESWPKDKYGFLPLDISEKSYFKEEIVRRLKEKGVPDDMIEDAWKDFAAPAAQAERLAGEAEIVKNISGKDVFYRGGEEFGALEKEGSLFFTDSEDVAKQYADEEFPVTAARLIMKNPLDLRPSTMGRDGAYSKISEVLGRTIRFVTDLTGADKQKLIDYAKKNGFDGLMMPDTDVSGRNAIESYVVFDKSQVQPAPAGKEVTWTITQRKGEIATGWQKGDATITVEKRPKTKAGTGGTRYVARIGENEYRALSLEDAQQWADAALAVQAQPAPAGEKAVPEESSYQKLLAQERQARKERTIEREKREAWQANRKSDKRLKKNGHLSKQYIKQLDAWAAQNNLETKEYVSAAGTSQYITISRINADKTRTELLKIRLSDHTSGQGEAQMFASPDVDIDTQNPNVDVVKEFEDGLNAYFKDEPGISKFFALAKPEGGKGTVGVAAKVIYTSTPDEWRGERTLVSWGDKGLRTPGNKMIRGRKSFAWSNEFEKVPTRLPDVIKAAKARTDEVFRVSVKKGEDYWLVPKKLMEQLRKDLPAEAFERRPKSEPTPKQLITYEINSMNRHGLRDSEIGARVTQMIQDYGLTEADVTANIKKYLEALENDPESEKLRQSVREGVEEAVRTAKELAEERDAIQAVEQGKVAAEIGDFLDGIVEKATPTETNLFGQKRPVLKGGALGKQEEFFDKERFKLPPPDIEGQMTFPAKPAKTEGAKQITLRPSQIKDLAEILDIRIGEIVERERPDLVPSLKKFVARIKRHLGGEIISDTAGGTSWRGKIDDQTRQDLVKYLNNEYAKARDFAKQEGTPGAAIRRLQNIFDALGEKPIGEIYNFKTRQWEKPVTRPEGGEGKLPGGRQAGAIIIPPVTTVGKVQEAHPELEVSGPQKDIGWLQDYILTLGNQSVNSKVPEIIEAAETMIDTGMVMSQEIDHALTIDRHFYGTLPKEYRVNKGEKFFDLMDKHYSLEDITADNSLPDAVKKVLTHFKQNEEVMRQEIIRQKREMAKAVLHRKKKADLLLEAEKAGFETTYATINSKGEEVLKTKKKSDIIEELVSQIYVPDNWGRQWSHILHIWFGQYQLSWQEIDPETGKAITHFIGRAETQKDAYIQLANWMDAREKEGLPKVVPNATREYHVPYDVHRVSRKQFYALEEQLKEAAKIDSQEIDSALRGVIGKKESKQKWYPALLRRKGAEGYSKDFLRVWKTETRYFYRWKMLTEMNRQVEPLIEKIKSMGLKNWANHLEETKDFMWGRNRSLLAQNVDEMLAKIPFVKDIIRPFALERWAGWIKTYNYMRHLQTPKFYVLNTLQLLQTLYPVVGEKGLYRGAKLYYSKEGQEILQRYNVMGMSGKLHELGMLAERKIGRYLPAGASERRNQGIAFLAIYDDAVRRDVLPEVAARLARLRGQVFTQFAYSPADIPKALRGPIGGLIFQYKRFSIKSLELVARLARDHRWGGVARWLAAQFSIGGIRAFIKLFPTTLVGYLAYELYKETKDRYGEEVADVVDHGLPGLVGIDLSGSVGPVDAPQGRNAAEKIGNIFLGVSGQSIARLYADLTEAKLSAKKGILERGIKSIVETSPTMKQFVFLAKALEKDTTQFDSKERMSYQLEVEDLWKKAFGFRPETETIQRMQIEAMLSLKYSLDKAEDDIVLALLDKDIKSAIETWVAWDTTFPDAPISPDSIERRFEERGLAHELPTILRVFKELPMNLRPSFLREAMESTEKISK